MLGSGRQFTVGTREDGGGREALGDPRGTRPSAYEVRALGDVWSDELLKDQNSNFSKHLSGQT